MTNGQGMKVNEISSLDRLVEELNAPAELRRINIFERRSRRMGRKLIVGELVVRAKEAENDEPRYLTTFSKADEDWDLLRNQLVGRENLDLSRNQLVGY